MIYPNRRSSFRGSASNLEAEPLYPKRQSKKSPHKTLVKKQKNRNPDELLLANYIDKNLLQILNIPA
ncbi:MAG: hypothetical protein A2Y67_03335 [Candidatus Buchananbacteria bacterium RBG_13_39_9]|uniref:Uncharacterized protein n=1 Tax=Candidatus Buchananbacteria bacterium RBG_13_39_9 TaxID=1797531 RepID=A0A1G1XSD4_9BACT|nr:MAG: hypothetical protein A2Y67_03335 [Candidatus Buchananbacteria bacterium RBG_13_39_9]